MAKRRTRPSKKRQSVLQDHKKIGSVLIPPFKIGLDLTEVRYVHDLLPELCWIGLLNQALGYAEGVKFATNTARAARSLFKTEHFVNFALSSSFDTLDEPQRASLLETLQGHHLLQVLQAALAPLNVLFEQSALRFLGTPSHLPDRGELVKRLRNCVTDLFDKHTQPALVAQAAVLYIRGVTGGLYILEGVQPPNLDAIVNAPGSESGQQASAMVRSAVLQEILHVDGKTRPWPRIFWNAALFVDACDLGEATT